MHENRILAMEMVKKLEAAKIRLADTLENKEDMIEEGDFEELETLLSNSMRMYPLFTEEELNKIYEIQKHFDSEYNRYGELYGFYGFEQTEEYEY